MTTVRKRDLVTAGSLSADQRKYLYTALVFLLPDHPILHVPAVGTFSVVRTALEAGYKPENIYASDVSLSAGILGNLIDPKSEPVAHELSKENEARWEIVSNTMGSDSITYAAFLYWCMKRAEYTSEERLADMLDHVDENMEMYVEQLRSKIEKQVIDFKGIHYKHAQLTDVLKEERTSEEVVVVVPPAYVGRKVKGFDYGDEIAFEPAVEPYTYSREFPALFDSARTSPAPHIWAQAKNLAGFTEYDVLYANEQRPDRIDYLVTSNMSMFEGHKKSVNTFKRPKNEAYPAPIWGPEDEIRADSKIWFVAVTQSTANYYRDLWAHKLGATSGDLYLLMLIDGKVYSVVVMMLADFMNMRSEYLFQQSGFSAPSTRYPHMHRLLMWCLTCREFGDFIIGSFSRNRFHVPKGLKTTCLSKYRKMKSNNGILEITHRERMEKTGLHKLSYITDFREENYTRCIQRTFQDHGLDENGKAAE